MSIRLKPLAYFFGMMLLLGGAASLIVMNNRNDTFTLVRLNNGQAIISERLITDAGDPAGAGNINGPSVIRIPDWIPTDQRIDPSAKYYLYFAHHLGSYIRLAWAERIEGPWHLYNTRGEEGRGRGVIDIGEELWLEIGNALAIRGHIASPEVLVDHENRRIILYFHGPYAFRGKKQKRAQKTFVSYSANGLDFSRNIQPVILGPSYFRLFNHRDQLYAFSNGAYLHRARDPGNPWEPPPDFDFNSELWESAEVNPFKDDLAEAGFDEADLRVRHVALRQVEDLLQVFYSRRGDKPERIQLSTINLAEHSWDKWDASYPPQEVVDAQEDWEGGNLAPKHSREGPAKRFANELRDPFVFEDIDGQLYLFYSGGGERGIGVARMDN